MASGAIAGAARADEGTVSGFAFGGTGETVFEHTRAALRDPHFGMRFYLAPKVPGTLSPVTDPGGPDANARADAKGGNHLFWDVAFGERAPVLGWYDVHPTRSVRHARGFQLNLDAAAFLLLDFNAQSSAVINTDYRLGVSGDLRPWRDGWDRLSVSVGAFHQSTHLGDEYVLSAQTIQAGGVPSANPYLPYRANPSYIGFPATLSVDLGPVSQPQYSARVYGGGTLFVDSGIPAAGNADARLGVELRYGQPELTSEIPQAPPQTRACRSFSRARSSSVSGTPPSTGTPRRSGRRRVCAAGSSAAAPAPTCSRTRASSSASSRTIPRSRASRSS